MTINPDNIEQLIDEAYRKAAAYTGQVLNAGPEVNLPRRRPLVTEKKTAPNTQSEKHKLPDPIPLESEREPPPEYPLEALDGILGDAAKAIACHVQAPLAMAGQCVLSAASYLAQTRITAPQVYHRDGMPASLWLLTLGQSGDRKTQCRRLAIRTIEEAERQARDQFQRETNQYSDMLDSLKGKDKIEFLETTPKPSNPRTLYSDTTWEKLAGDFIRGMSAAAMDSDEGAQLLGGYSLKSDARTAILGGFTKAFDSGCIERDRSAGNQETSGIAYDRRLTLHLLAQPVSVAEALGDPVMRGQGFLARFLFAAPDSLAGTRFQSREKLEEKPHSNLAIRRYWNRCEKIQQMRQYVDETGAVKAPIIQIEDKARDAWIAFYNETEAKQALDGELSSGLRPFAARAGELVCRVAAVLAFFEEHTSIPTAVMERACALVRYSLAEWRRYICGSGVDRDLADAQRLLEWMKKKGKPVDRRMMVQSHRKTFVPSTDRAGELLDILVEHHWLIDHGSGQFSARVVPTLPTLPTSPATTAFSIANTMPTNAYSSGNNGELLASVGNVLASPNSANLPAVGNVGSVGMAGGENPLSAGLGAPPPWTQGIDDCLLAEAEQRPDNLEVV